MNKILFFAISVIVLSACQKDEPELAFIGSWQATSFTFSAPVDINEDGIMNTDFLKEDNCLSWNIDFFEDGALHFRTKNIVNRYVKLDDELIVTHSYCDEKKRNGTWTINDSSSLLNLSLEVPEQEDVILNIVVVMKKNRLTFMNFPFGPDDFTSMEVVFQKI